MVLWHKYHSQFRVVKSYMYQRKVYKKQIVLILSYKEKVFSLKNEVTNSLSTVSKNNLSTLFPFLHPNSIYPNLVVAQRVFNKL